MEAHHPIQHNSDLTPKHHERMTLRAFMNRQSCLKPDVFLPLARAIALCVREIHQNQTLHLDLRPETIWVDAHGTEAGLIHSGYSLQKPDSGYVRPVPVSPRISDAGLPYCSPEHTGRMRRAVDERSDLYSLGIMFYEMLAGCTPFFADSPHEWVYLHLTQSPPSFSNHGVQLPLRLESIVMKLLEKNPDNRYPNIHLLIADIDKTDRSHHTLSIEPGFHGRESEISILTQAFHSACFGPAQLVYVSGEAGIGKTTLIDELFRHQQRSKHFFYISGKFEQLSKGSPYHAIIQAFRGLMRHLLGERKDQVELWKEKLRAALGTNAGVITAMIPEAELLLEITPAVEVLPSLESKKRFTYVFRKFVQTLATETHPLVLFIDDLQWADSSSLQLIHTLLCDPECQYLMLICAFRHMDIEESRLPGYEADGSVSKQAMIHHIHLSPLRLEQMNRIVMETLHSQAEPTLPLTELLVHRSGGNPFHFKQILLRLQDDGILLYNHELGCWQWNLGQIIAQESNFCIHDIIRRRLYHLPGEAQDLLKIAACAGSIIDLHLIASVTRRKIDDITAAWSLIEAEGMILPIETNQFQFTHDQIQKLIYNQLDDVTKQEIHLRIGRCMNEESSGFEEHPFDVVDHLNRGSKRITDTQEILQLARLNLAAGNRAKSSTAFDAALEYFRKGVKLLAIEDWINDFELCFELHAQKAECEYLCGHEQESEQGIDFLLGQARNPSERSRVQMIRIMQYINNGKYLESTALGLQSLREHHIYIPSNPGSFVLMMERIRMETLLRNQYDRLAHLKEMSDQDRIAAMNLIFALVPSTFFTNKKVYFLLMCRAIQLSLQYGNTPVSAAVYSSFGMILGNTWGQFEKGYALSKVGVELSERYNMTAMKSKTYTLFGGVLCALAGHTREADVYLAKALRFGLDSGDYVFASYAMGAHVNSLFTRAPLSELADTIADYMAVLEITNDEFVKQNFYLYQRYILALQGGTAALDSFCGDGFEEDEFLRRIRKEETAATTLFQYSTYKTQLHYLSGRYEEAFRWALEAGSYQAYASHLPHLPECLFYESLAASAAYTQPRREPHLKKTMLRNLRRFKKWSVWSPATYQAKYDLLQAEIARAAGQITKAEELYDKAVRGAREHGDIRVISLVGEIAADHYRRSGRRKTAIFYLQMAVEGYKEWGVSVKVGILQELLLQWQQEEAADQMAGLAPAEPQEGRSDPEPTGELSGPRRESPSLEGVNLAAILETTQAISNQTDTETALLKIMNTIMKYAGASKGALLTGVQDALYVQVIADSAQPAVPSPFEVKDSTLLPEGIIRYVFRTQENVLYTGGEDSWLIHNPYLAAQRPQSVLCIPVTVHGTRLGILYLENRLAGDVFTYDHLPVLLAMASQGILMCVLQGSTEPYDPQLGIEEQDQPLPGIDEPLTDREQEVLALLAAGLSNKEIADHLTIAIGTVKVHVKNIFNKLKVNRRTKAIAQAKELHLLD